MGAQRKLLLKMFVEKITGALGFGRGYFKSNLKQDAGSSMRFLITRPEPDATRLVEQLEALGHEGLIEPLLRIEYLSADFSLKKVRGLIITSRNALRWVRHCGGLSRLNAFPVYAVGRSTARMARELGFTDVFEGPGTSEGLAELICEKVDVKVGKLLHLSGEDVADDIVPKLEPYGLSAKRVIVYRSVAADGLSERAVSELRNNNLDGVILLSPKTCRIWVKLVSGEESLLNCTLPKAYCLSEGVAAPLKNLENVSKIIARKPNIEELLSLIESETV